MSIANIDHVAVTTGDLSAFIAFYERVLSAQVEEEHELDGQRSFVRLRVGQAMFNVHRAGHSHPLVARTPQPGAVDICFRWAAPICDALALLDAAGVTVIEGPVARTSTVGLVGQSVYFRDPDGNLLELLSTVPD